MWYIKTAAQKYLIRLLPDFFYSQNTATDYTD